MWNDSRANVLLLSPKQRQVEALVQALKGECIRIEAPLSLEDARRVVANFVSYSTPCACIVR